MVTCRAPATPIDANIQPLLDKKQESIAFLYSLASAAAPPKLIPVSLPSLAPPPSRDIATSPISPSTPRLATQSLSSKAQLLRDYRKSRGYAHISERLLLRDALYLLQGISGKYVKISTSKEDDNDRVVFLEDSVGDRLSNFPTSSADALRKT